MGRFSIFWICVIILINSFGLLIIFFNAFGGTTADLMKELFWPGDDVNHIGVKPATYAIGLAVLLLPFIAMKELAELKIVSIGLFTTAILFVLVNVIQVLVRGIDKTNPDQDYSQYQTGNFNTEFIQALTIIFTAFNFSQNLFPIHTHQVDKSLKASVRSISISMLLVGGIYVTLAIACIFKYGTATKDVVLKNLGKNKEGEIYWENYMLRIFFLIILACHIPYLYFGGKEALLIIVDEIWRKSISFTLSEKLLAENA